MCCRKKPPGGSGGCWAGSAERDRVFPRTGMAGIRRREDPAALLKGLPGKNRPAAFRNRKRPQAFRYNGRSCGRFASLAPCGERAVPHHRHPFRGGQLPRPLPRMECSDESISWRDRMQRVFHGLVDLENPGWVPMRGPAWKKSSGKRNPFLRFLNVRPIDGIMKTA